MPGRGRDQHPVVGDVLDPPAGGAEGEDVADAGLVDHLLVELADPPARALAADQEDAEQAAVGDGAAAGHGQPLGAGPAGELPGDAVPDDAGPQLGELVARVAAAEQVEGGVVGAAGQLRRTARSGVRGRRGRRPARRPSPVMATTCWASTSSGLAGTRSDSISAGAHPLARRRRSGRGRRGAWGTARPRLTSPTWWPARPTRWRALATLGGDSIWMTRSTAPMSMPSSRLLVATTHGQPAALEVVLDERPLLLGHRAVVGLGDHRVPRPMTHPTGPSPARGWRRSPARGPFARSLLFPKKYSIGKQIRLKVDILGFSNNSINSDNASEIKKCTIIGVVKSGNSWKKRKNEI